MRFRLFIIMSICMLLQAYGASAQSLEGVVTPQGMVSQVISHRNFTTSWNYDLKIPNWVSWSIEPSELAKIVSRGNTQFTPDPDARGEVSTMDYSRSGYDRGHMCPAADNRYDADAMAESFYLSNVCPQDHTLNEQTWNVLENACRSWAQYGTVWIVCGPWFDGVPDKRIGWNEVAVPDGFWKVVLRNYRGTWQAIGFIFKNEAVTDSWRNYAVSVDEVESLTGLDFFSALDDDVESEVESTFSLASWRY